MPVPINQRRRQLAIQGKIRLGVKDNSKQGRRAIDTFRFTSPDKTALDTIAARYGGEVRPWSDPKASPKNQFEVITTATEIKVWLPEDCIDERYELWSGGGCQRRCDGVTVEVPVESGDGWEPRQAPCICDAKGKMECRYQLRADFVLPDVQFGGVWRVESKSEFLSQELPQMVETIQAMQARGFTPGVLSLESRQSMGGRHKFVVPVLRAGVSPEQILSGQAPALMAADVTAPALDPVNLVVDDDDDGIVDAEIVDDFDDLLAMPNAPRELPDLTDRQINGLRSGAAKWSAEVEGKVVQA